MKTRYLGKLQLNFCAMLRDERWLKLRV